jgi:hypothetical protein
VSDGRPSISRLFSTAQRSFPGGQSGSVAHADGGLDQPIL